MRKKLTLYFCGSIFALISFSSLADNTVTLTYDSLKSQSIKRIGYNAENGTDPVVSSQLLLSKKPAFIRFFAGVDFYYFSAPKVKDCGGSSFKTLQNAITQKFTPARVQDLLKVMGLVNTQVTQLVFSNFHMPSSYVDITNKPPIFGRLNDIVSYSCFLTAEVGLLVDQGIKISWFDPVNESDYEGYDPNHDGYIAPWDYAKFISTLRSDLNSHGLSSVRIMGPSAAMMTSVAHPSTPYPSIYWLSAWSAGKPLLKADPNLTKDLDAIDFHTWWYDSSKEGGTPTEWAQTAATIKKWYPNKPLIVSEFAAKAGPSNYPPFSNDPPNPPNSCKTKQLHSPEPLSSDPFGYCSVSNTYSYGTAVMHNFTALASIGVDALLLWESVDEGGTPSSSNPISAYGMIKAKALGGGARPFFPIISYVNSQIGDNAFTLIGSGDKIMGIYNKTNQTLVVVISNFTNSGVGFVVTVSNLNININKFAGVSYSYQNTHGSGSPFQPFKSVKLIGSNKFSVSNVPSYGVVVITIPMAIGKQKKQMSTDPNKVNNK